MKRKRLLIVVITLMMIISCGKTIVRTYNSTNDWDESFYTLTSDTSGYCHIHFKNADHKIYAELYYLSTYQTANELMYIDFDVVVDGQKLEASKESFRADDSDYKLIVGTQNTIKLNKNEEWKNLGTQLKIDTVKNEYLSFRVIIEKKFKVKDQFPKEINFVLHTKTKIGVKDTSVVMYYDEYEDNSAPFRFH